MDAIKVVNEQKSNVFENKCNELVQQGYIMQSCYCDFFNPHFNQDYTPEAIWFAIFALPEAVNKAERK